MGFLLIDAKKRSTNRIEPPCCGQFGTNSQADKVYLQLLQALVYTHDPRQNDGTVFLYSKRVSRRETTFNVYGIGLLPLIRALRFSFQRWIRLGTR
jgi:hypothetical protein